MANWSGGVRAGEVEQLGFRQCATYPIIRTSAGLRICSAVNAAVNALAFRDSRSVSVITLAQKNGAANFESQICSNNDVTSPSPTDADRNSTTCAAVIGDHQTLTAIIPKDRSAHTHEHPPCSVFRCPHITKIRQNGSAGVDGKDVSGFVSQKWTALPVQ